MPLQQLGRTDAGQLQQLGTLQRAGAKQNLLASTHVDFPSAFPIAHTDRAMTFKQYAPHHGTRLNRQIGPISRRLEIALGGGAPQAVAGGQLEVTDAFLGLAIEVVVSRNADLRPGTNEGLH